MQTKRLALLTLVRRLAPESVPLLERHLLVVLLFQHLLRLAGCWAEPLEGKTSKWMLLLHRKKS
jgi:hypothetical protein